MFERWTKRRNESAERNSYVAEAAARRRAELTQVVRSMIERGNAEEAMKIVGSAKAGWTKRSSDPASDEATRMAAADELKFLEELEDGARKVMRGKTAL